MNSGISLVCCWSGLILYTNLAICRYHVREKPRHYSITQ